MFSIHYVREVMGEQCDERREILSSWINYITM